MAQPAKRVLAGCGFEVAERNLVATRNGRTAFVVVSVDDCRINPFENSGLAFQNRMFEKTASIVGQFEQSLDRLPQFEIVATSGVKKLAAFFR